MQSRLSLPPLASCYPSGLHFSPHTSCLCDWYVQTMLYVGGALTSLVWINESSDPLEIRFPWEGFHDRELTRPSCCPLIVLILANWLVSQRCICLLEVPIARTELVPFIHATDVTMSLSFSVSKSCLISPVSEFHRYTVYARQTARMLCWLQSNRFR